VDAPRLQIGGGERKSFSANLPAESTTSVLARNTALAVRSLARQQAI
jgi:hypothetical protein